MKINLTIFINLVITLVLSTGLIACGGSGKSVADPNPFKIKVRTSNFGNSSDVQFQIPTTGGGYSYNVDCDSDGTLEATGETSDYICNYDNAGSGDYVISISGEFPQFYLDRVGDSEKVIELVQWGTGQWRSMDSMFEGAKNMVSIATDTPDISSVIDMREMFYDTKFNQDIGQWNVSKVINMSSMFGSSVFNQDISSWDVSKITDMSGMFSDSLFNQDISGWNVSNIIDMRQMFLGSAFNQNIGSWDVSSVTSMHRMFLNSTFNKDISSWDVSNVKDMGGMFRNTPFDQKIGNWNISDVTKLSDMFLDSTLSPENYDDLLIGWSSNNDLQYNLTFHAGNSVTGTLEGSQARAFFRSNFGWTIIDGN